MGIEGMKKQRLNSILGYLTTVLGVGAIIFLQNLHLNQIKSQKNTDYFREEESLKVMLDIQKRLPSFGFKNLLADWTFLKYVQYFGDTEAREKTGYSLIPEFFQTIVSSDPHFIEAALNLSTANSLYAGKPEKTVALMEQVLKSVSPETSPLACYVWLYKAVDEVLFIGDLESAKHSYKMAGKWASLVGHNTTAQRARETVRFLETNPDGKEARIAAWATILTYATDTKTRKYALEKIQALGAEVTINSQGKLKIKLPKSG